jgi:hypothetical protein
MDVDTAIHHLTALWPELPGQLVGATEDDLRGLEAAVRRALPGSYRRFLARVGRNDAGLGGGFTGALFHVAALRAHYEHGEWGVPGPLLLIGIDLEDGDVQMHTCLADWRMDDPPVVYTVLRRGMPSESLPAAQTLGELVFRYGFCNFFAYRLRIEGCGQLPRPDSKGVARIEQRLEGLGLTRHRCSGGYAAYFVGDGLVAHYTCPPATEQLLILVHGQDEVAVQAVMEDLTRDAGVRVDWIGATVDQHGHLESDESLEDADEEADEE